MPDTKIALDRFTPGLTDLYLIIRNKRAGTAWNPTAAAWQAYSAAAYASFKTAPSEVPTASGDYEFDFSTTGSAADTISWSWNFQSGGSPALSDTVVATGSEYWDGTTFGLASQVSSISTSLSDSIDLSITSSVNDPAPRAYGFSGAAGLSGVDNFYAQNGLALCFTSGALKGLKATIAGYEGASRKFSFMASFPSAPSDGDTFVIL